ncbi:MAG: hypothetical protein IH949_10910 [Bacteroidetes bacterium]|nr:hypothetical protein [Bacteroidota bacterium]
MKWYISFMVLEIPELNLKEAIKVLVCPNPDCTNLLGRDILLKCLTLFDGKKQTYLIEAQ